MQWLIFAVTAYLFWTSSNIINKIVLTRYVKNVFVYSVFVGFLGLLPLLLVPFKGLTIPSISFLILIFVTGMLYIYGLLPFYRALAIEEVSRVIPLWRFVPLFVLFFSAIFLGERLTGYEITAFFLLLAGGFLVSLRTVRNHFRVSKALYLAIISSFIFGIYHTLTKFIYLNQPFLNSFILMRIGSFFAALSLLFVKRYRQETIITYKSMTSRLKGTVVVNETLGILGLGFFNFAVSLASISLVTASLGILPVFVLIAASILSFRYPQLLEEEISKKIVLQKIVAIALIAVGTVIIAVG